MKKRSEDLNKHSAQAVTDWMQLQCSSYVMLCNFDELQCVLAMFAEDRKLLPDDLFISLVRECLDRSRQGKPSNTYDILGNLFQEMNRSGTTPAGRYQGVEYFNGGLFREVHPLELTEKELELLEAAAAQDWKAVRPSIFGNIFESAIGKSNKRDRHAHGIHFTSEEDILKIVRPTITRYWEDKIAQATTDVVVVRGQQGEQSVGLAGA